MAAMSSEEKVQAASDWWSTEIIDIHPGEIAIRGYPIQELIGNMGFAEMIWLMLRGELPTRGQAELLVVKSVAQHESVAGDQAEREGGQHEPECARAKQRQKGKRKQTAQNQSGLLGDLLKRPDVRAE